MVFSVREGVAKRDEQRLKCQAQSYRILETKKEKTKKQRKVLFERRRAEILVSISQ